MIAVNTLFCNRHDSGVREPWADTRWRVVKARLPSIEPAVLRVRTQGGQTGILFPVLNQTRIEPERLAQCSNCLLWPFTGNVEARQTIVHLPMGSAIELKQQVGRLFLHCNGKAGLALAYVVVGEMNE